VQDRYLVTAMTGRQLRMAITEPAKRAGSQVDGELAELRRSDIDVKNGIVHVRRGVVRINGGRKVKGPKSEAGRRDVAIPPHLIPAVKDHLRKYVLPKRDALLFPAASGGHMARPRCTGCTTRRVRRPGGRIYGSTTCGTPGPCSPPRPAPRWPN
jgi:integrase